MILQLRLQKKISVLEVARHLGISADQYQRIEDGAIKATPEMLTKLAGYYLKDEQVLASAARITININSGNGSHSNSGIIQTYMNGTNEDLEHRLRSIENMLLQILAEIRER